MVAEKIESAAEACPEAPRCTRPKGHEGPHGFGMPGFVLAPFEGTKIGTEPEQTTLGCNTSHCAGHMRMTRFEGGGGAFACDTCEQVVRLQPDGTYTEIFADLYPEKMDKGMKRKFLAYRVHQFQFIAEASLLCGMSDQASYESRLLEIEDAASRYREEHKLDETRPWWKVR